MILRVLQFPDNRLRHKAKPVTEFDDSLSRLADDMLETMYAMDGIGLASIQVNVRQSVVVMDLSETKNEPKVFINPRFEPDEAVEQILSKEGCLSLPELSVEVLRHPGGVLHWQDLQGVAHQTEATDLFAICCQHELDHLQGKVLADYMTAAQRRIYKKELENISREGGVKPVPQARGTKQETQSIIA